MEDNYMDVDFDISPNPLSKCRKLDVESEKSEYCKTRELDELSNITLDCESKIEEIKRFCVQNGLFTVTAPSLLNTPVNELNASQLGDTKFFSIKIPSSSKRLLRKALISGIKTKPHFSSRPIFSEIQRINGLFTEKQ
jgi:hypothetical protein